MLGSLSNHMDGGVSVHLPNKANPVLHGEYQQRNGTSSWNSNSYTKNARVLMQNHIKAYLKTLPFCSQWEDNTIERVSNQLDDRLYSQASSLEVYTTLDTLPSRVIKLLRYLEQSHVARFAMSHDSSSLPTNTAFVKSVPGDMRQQPSNGLNFSKNLLHRSVPQNQIDQLNQKNIAAHNLRDSYCLVNYNLRDSSELNFASLQQVHQVQSDSLLSHQPLGNQQPLCSQSLDFQKVETGKQLIGEKSPSAYSDSLQPEPQNSEQVEGQDGVGFASRELKDQMSFPASKIIEPDSNHLISLIVSCSRALSCSERKAKCDSPECSENIILLDHLAWCGGECAKCKSLNIALGHYRNCNDSSCHVCVPVHEIFDQDSKRVLNDTDICLSKANPPWLSPRSHDDTVLSKRSRTGNSSTSIRERFPIVVDPSCIRDSLVKNLSNEQSDASKSVSTSIEAIVMEASTSAAIPIQGSEPSSAVGVASDELNHNTEPSILAKGDAICSEENKQVIISRKNIEVKHKTFSDTQIIEVSCKEIPDLQSAIPSKLDGGQMKQETLQVPIVTDKIEIVDEPDKMGTPLVVSTLCRKTKETLHRLSSSRERSEPMCNSLKSAPNHHKICMESCHTGIPVRQSLNRGIKRRLSDADISQSTVNPALFLPPSQDETVSLPKRLRTENFSTSTMEISPTVVDSRISSDLLVKSLPDVHTDVSKYVSAGMVPLVVEANTSAAIPFQSSEPSSVVGVTSDEATGDLSHNTEPAILEEVDIISFEENKQVMNRTHEIEVKHKIFSDISSTEVSCKEISGVQSSIPFKLVVGQIKRESNQVQIVTNKIGTNAEPDKMGMPLVGFACETLTAKTKIKGVSLIEWFTPDQANEYVRCIRQLDNKGRSNVVETKESQLPVDENTCQLCGLLNLSFDPPAIFCASCSGRIPRSRTYYVMAVTDTLGYQGGSHVCFCNRCYKGTHGEFLRSGDVAFPKAKLVKKQNNETVMESWVQCDKCAFWQHQICGLFNDMQNEKEKAEYTCPICYVRELENGERVPLSPNVLLGATNLPKSKLSDFIENRLSTSLKQEREERAKKLGKHFHEVPGAEPLVVRVVSSIEKKQEVKSHYYDIFKELNYPKELIYKSKAILLFQKIDGVDILIFAMYVQEYGSDCTPPNQRHVYLSYLDSVKYFSPEIEAVTGEALRTFVYHEILIAYLDHSKRRGFTSCYIWSCPSLKREDFILNCHPEKQKIPKPEKLRDWYRAMLKKAAKEKIVVRTTNLHDYFFMPAKECKAKTTTARLPYFEGDFWPSHAEEVLKAIKQEEGKEPTKKGKLAVSRRALKALKCDVSAGNSKDIILMNKIEDAIRPAKDNFILVHLHHACNHCCRPIITGTRWTCNLCQNFQLCEKCHEIEKILDDKKKHPMDQKETHPLSPVQVIGVPADTTDEDEPVQSEIFDNRISFLNFCQEGRYQYDTLRHAKYSTMMILYQHHQKIALSRSKSGDNTKTDLGQQSECSNSGLLNPCHQANSQCKTLSLGREQQPFLKPIFPDLLLHCVECHGKGCSYPFCRKLKILFHHGKVCSTRYKGGCSSCNKMWYILSSHALSCDQPVCRVPRCLDLRKRISKLKEHGIGTCL